MGSRGPKKTPTAVLERRGSWRAKKRIGAEVAAGDPLDLSQVPEHLDDNGLAIWHSLGGLLVANDVLKETDQLTFVRMCDCYSAYCVARDGVRAGGQVSHGENNDVVSPFFRNFITLQDRLDRFAKTFGLTPSDRADVFGAIDGNESDPAETFFE